ncbi:anaerobic glycerol-3-phosphate dehydrogenase subunit C [Moorella naiadis]|uniref:anaerobic glycerol-3-phosphate dehydrogenase subunit C n=1 Tax=Moorella naiadis (nom. illeg.) TaxID=3093670 RepID=UPI003D9C9309
MKLTDINVKEFEACQKCSLCESFCPVIPIKPSFPGPKIGGANAARLVAMKSAVQGMEAWLEDLDYCTDCRTCDVVCPSNIKPATLIMKQRWQIKGRTHRTLREFILSRPDRLGALTSLWPGGVNLILKQKVIRIAAALVAGITAERSLPGYARRTFRNWYAGIYNKTAPKPDRVAYFYGCYTNFYRPDIGKGLVQLFQVQGVGVELPEQKCCGLPLAINGDFASARNLAAANLRHILPYVEAGLPLVFTCPSCAAMFKSYYTEVYDLPGAEKVARASFDACEYILSAMPGLLEKSNPEPVPLKVAYHTPCHLRAQGIGTPAVELLEAIPGLGLKVLRNNCCGMAGTYGYKTERYDVAMKIGAALFQDIQNYRPDLVVTDCGTCALQIQEGTGYLVRHPVELLYQAYTAGSS